MSSQKVDPHSPERERYRERERSHERTRVWDRGNHQERERQRDRGWDKDKSDRDRRSRDGGWESERQRSRDRGGGGEREKEREKERGQVRGKDRDREVGRKRDKSPRDQKGGNRSRSKGGFRAEPRRARSRSPLLDPQVSFDKSRQRAGKSNSSDTPAKDKEKPNFENTGLLAAASNTVNSVVLKYTEPVDSRLPPAHSRWRLFTFKNGEIIGNPLDLNSQPTWLIGRDRLVADIPVDHPSCSKQHAVIQFRNAMKKNEFGDQVGGVRPYVIDLKSANGTFLNKMKLEDRRFVEMREGDLLMFGESTR